MANGLWHHHQLGESIDCRFRGIRNDFEFILFLDEISLANRIAPYGKGLFCLLMSHKKDDRLNLNGLLVTREIDHSSQAYMS